MARHTIMEATELVPALRFALQPEARLLLLADEASAAQTRLKSVAEVAAELGHTIETAPDYRNFEGAVPDALLFDGLAPNVMAQMRQLRALAELEWIPFVALTTHETSDAQLLELGRAGASCFVDAEAATLDVASRLQNAIELGRARVENAGLRERLAHQLRVDDVTGVMTRRVFFQQAHRECARARRYGHPLSCLMVEVDHYRMLCATFSDATGESVLRAVATTLGQWTRDSDVIARFGEAKFVVLLPETNLDGATSAREKVLTALREHPWRFDNRMLPVSVSIGEAQLKGAPKPMAFGDDSESDEMGETALSTREAMAGLLEDADAALYIARKGARVPDVFVPYTPAPEEIPLLGSV